MTFRLFDDLVNRLARLIHPDKPREWFENVVLPTDIPAAEAMARLEEAAKAKGLHFRSIVDALKTVGLDSGEENRARMAMEAEVVAKTEDYKGTAKQNTALWNYLLKAIQQRGIPLPAAD